MSECARRRIGKLEKVNSSSVCFFPFFGRLANLSTEDSTPFLFYMSGSVLWSLFSSSLTTNGNLFLQNSELFGKVYFPRLTVVISNSIMSIIQFTLQFLIFTFFIPCNFHSLL